MNNRQQTTQARIKNLLQQFDPSKVTFNEQTQQYVYPNCIGSSQTRQLTAIQKKKYQHFILEKKKQMKEIKVNKNNDYDQTGYNSPMTINKQFSNYVQKNQNGPKDIFSNKTNQLKKQSNSGHQNKHMVNNQPTVHLQKQQNNNQIKKNEAIKIQNKYKTKIVDKERDSYKETQKQKQKPLPAPAEKELQKNKADIKERDKLIKIDNQQILKPKNIEVPISNNKQQQTTLIADINTIKQLLESSLSIKWLEMKTLLQNKLTENHATIERSVEQKLNKLEAKIVQKERMQKNKKEEKEINQKEVYATNKAKQTNLGVETLKQQNTALTKKVNQLEQQTKKLQTIKNTQASINIKLQDQNQRLKIKLNKQLNIKEQIFQQLHIGKQMLSEDNITKLPLAWPKYLSKIIKNKQNQFFLNQSIAKFTGRDVDATDLLFMKTQFQVNLQPYIRSSTANLLFLFESMQGNIFGVYANNIYIPQQGKPPSLINDNFNSFMFNAKTKQMFWKKKEQSQNIKSVQYANGYIYFGIKQMMIKNKELGIIKPLFQGIGNKYFQIYDRKQLTGEDQDQVAIRYMEIHHITLI